jgi:hypothetical protein
VLKEFELTFSSWRLVLAIAFEAAIRVLTFLYNLLSLSFGLNSVVRSIPLCYRWLTYIKKRLNACGVLRGLSRMLDLKLGSCPVACAPYWSISQAVNRTMCLGWSESRFIEVSRELYRGVVRVQSVGPRVEVCCWWGQSQDPKFRVVHAPRGSRSRKISQSSILSASQLYLHSNLKHI